ncbi:MAG: thiol reductant ABC exporter subunit CydC [Acidimicrobiales bacterium]
MSAPGDPPTSAVVRRLVRIGQPSWGRLALATLLGLAAAMATVGLLAGSGYVVDRAAFRPGLGAIAGILASVEVLAFLRGPLRYGERLVAHDVAFRTLGRWRVWLYDQLEPLSPAGLRAWRSGDLLARATDDVDALGDLYLRVLLPVVVTVAAAALAVVVVAVILPVAGLILGASLLGAIVFAPVVAVLQGGGTSAAREAECRGELTAQVVDLVQGAPELMAFGQEEVYVDRIDAVDTELTALARRRALTAGTTSAVVTSCMGVAVVGVLAAGVAALRAHRMEPVMLAVLPLAAVGAFESVPALAMAALRTRQVVAAGRRLLAIDAIPVPVHDPAQPDTLPPGCPDVAVEKAHLRYRPDLPWALRGLDLSLPAGGRVALVGASGSGKTSLVNVLLRFWPLDSGRAALGGVDLDRLDQARVRRTVALVDQHARLFSGTIRQNVTLGRPDADEADVDAAIGRAQLAEWVGTLPMGVDTPIGEEGSQVSGGQRQRIALARALLVDAPILLLDEVTSGLDGPTAARLLTDVLAAADGRTVLLVTHRHADLAGFATVVRIERGRVAVA